MINQQHPITPPPELVQQWHDECHKVHEPFLVYIANQSAHWGWDQRGAATEAELQQARDEELEACREWLDKYGLGWTGLNAFRDARRPKLPSLKEQALAALKDMDLSLDDGHNASTIRRALEALPND
tara:strand:- start:2780 stop:3160 length:381 start_codon:yes stop_codon:yes gene_type:complete